MCMQILILYKMLKLILKNRCRLCSSITSNMQILPENVRYYGFPSLHLDDTKRDILTMKQNTRVKKKEVHVWEVSRENIKEVKAILNKYNISTSDLKNDSRIFVLSPWIVEQRIMFLQEIGTTIITLTDIQKFYKKMYLPVSICKANFGIKPDVNLAKNIFSWVDDNSIFTLESLTKFDQTMPMRMYYLQCLLEYLKCELDLNDEQVESVLKHRVILYNSFRLLSKLLKLLKNDLQLTTDLIIKNKWLLRIHPENVEKVLNLIDNTLHENYHPILLKNLKILKRNSKDLEALLSYLKKCKITPEIIRKHMKMLLINSNEFKRRVDVLSKIPITLVFFRHQRFPLLVQHFNKVLPRVRYLESKNLKYATINSLTVGYNSLDRLIAQRKTCKLNLKSFCDTIFEDNSDLVLQRIVVHPYCYFVPLLQLYETYIYLKEIFSMELIYKHAYAMLYNKTDLEVARENLLKESEYHKFPAEQFLVLCIYKIEEKCHFSGEVVLTPGKYAETANEDFDQARKIKEASNEH